MRGAREVPAPRDSLSFQRASLHSRNEFESETFTIVLHATSSFTYVSVIYGANFSFKARLGSPHCSYLAARFPPCMSFPFSQACSPMPTAATMLALCAFSVSSFGPARPPHDDHSLVSTSIRMRSHRMFFTMRMRISPSKSACAVTNFFKMRMRISPSHGCGLRSYTHAVALVLTETESSCDEGCFGLCPWPDKF